MGNARTTAAILPQFNQKSKENNGDPAGKCESNGHPQLPFQDENSTEGSEIAGALG